MSMDVVIAGAGMGGLSASIAMGLKGQQTTLLERREVFGEVGAGIQLGPNSTRLLQSWGLSKALETYAAWPSHIEVFRFDQQNALARLSLGESFKARYGAPYATIHRADLQAILYERMQAIGQTHLCMGASLRDLKSTEQSVQIQVQMQDKMQDKMHDQDSGSSKMRLLLEPES